MTRRKLEGSSALWDPQVEYSRTIVPSGGFLHKSTFSRWDLPKWEFCGRGEGGGGKGVSGSEGGCVVDTSQRMKGKRRGL